MAAPHLEAFLEAARYFIGLRESDGNNSFTDPRGRDLWSLFGWDASGTPWCAIFVSACAQKAEIANVLVAKSTWARGICEDTRTQFGGTWVDGPNRNGGNPVTPHPGDLILFRTGSGAEDYHVGIVEFIDGDTIHTIEGNTSNECARREYLTSHQTISAFVTPDWGKIGDSIDGNVVVGPLYQNRNDRHDMTLRQVGYLDRKYQLSDNSSNIAISVINYTSLLGDLYEMFAPGTISTGQVTVDTSQLQGNARITMDYLLSMGFSASGASVITGCMKKYSDINPECRIRVGNNKYLYGICAWPLTDLGDMRRRLGNDWTTNLSGQLEYFLDDLVSTNSILMLSLKLLQLDEDNVETGVESFLGVYNEYFDTDNDRKEAAEFATEIYNNLIITQAQMVGTSGKYVDIEGNPLSPKSSVEVPSSVPQTGMIDDYTSYSFEYGRWYRGSPHEKLSKIWAQQGFPSDGGIAQIGGYYCVAVRPRFGEVGDVLQINLEENVTFPAIICDTKGADAAEWGHPYGDKYSLVEWQRVKTIDGQVTTSVSSAADVDHAHESDWLEANWNGRFHKKVISMINYGKYADVRWT